MIDLRNHREFNPNPPATRAEITAAEQRLGSQLPPDYIEFLMQSDGGWGLFCDTEINFFRASELEPIKDQDGRVFEALLWVLPFGTNGGGEAYAFNRERADWPVVLVPWIGIDREAALPYGGSFDAFLDHLVSGFGPFEQRSK